MSSPVSQNNSAHIKHLRQFYEPQKQLFTDAQQLPQFFQTNLIDDMRVVKYFHNDPQANIKIFYYQYLKLCFQIDNVDYESYIEKIYELIRTQGFQFYFQATDPEKEIKNAQYKSLLIDFFQLMNSSTLTIDNVLKDYPVLNDVFSNFFRSVIMIASITPSYQAYIDKNELFDFLSSFFSVDISSYDKCLKFVESDIFVYEENPYNIYMAYIAEDVEESLELEQTSSSKKRGSHLLAHEMNTVKQDDYESEVSANTQQNSQNQQNQIGIRLIQHTTTNSSFIPQDGHKQTDSHSLKPRAKTIIKESYIESQFADYTSFSNNISSFGKNVSYEQEKEIVIEQLQPNKTANENESQGENKRVFMTENVYEEHAKNQQLTRVRSENNHFFQKANRADSQEIQITEAFYKRVQQQNKINELNKATSQPIFGFGKNSLNEMSESCFESLDSNLQIEKSDGQQANQTILQQQQKNENEKFQRQREKQRLMKKGITSLGLQQPAYMLVSYQQPTKDPGFMQKDLTARYVQQIVPESQQSIGNKNYNKTVETEMKNKSPITIASSNQKYPNLGDESLFYNPKLQSTKKSIQNQKSFKSSYTNSKYGQFNNFQKEYFYNNPTGNNASSKQSIPSNNGQSAMQQKLKLNVTKQFTNSFVMKSMTQPYKTDVYKIRERARQFRKNIYRQFNFQAEGGISDYGLKSGSEIEVGFESSRPSVGEGLSLSNMKSQQQVSTKRQSLDYAFTTNRQAQQESYRSNLEVKKPSSRTSIPSESTLRAASTGRDVESVQRLQANTSYKSPKTQQATIYPVSMVKQQQRIFTSNNTNQLPSLNTSKLVVDLNSNSLSKITEIKQASEVTLSASTLKQQSSKIINQVEGKNLYNYERQGKMAQEQGKVTVSIYNNPQAKKNSEKQLPVYQPVLTGTKPVINSAFYQPQTRNYPQQQYKTELPQPKQQQQYNNNIVPQQHLSNTVPSYQQSTYTPHTVMPPNHHHPHTYQQHNQHYKATNVTQQKTQVNSIGSAKSFPPQEMMSMIPQAQRPLPLYVPFERRK